MRNSEAERFQYLADSIPQEDIKALQLVLASDIKISDGPTIRGKCHDCKHSRAVANNAHIECVKPDVMMTGQQHGVRNGWFMYPLLFDPTWMTKECVNFESVSLVRKSNGKSE